MKIRIFSVLWCPSCIVMRPKYNDLKKKNNNLVFEEYDFDEEKEIFSKYEIGKTLPVLVLFDENGREIKRLIGEKSKKQFKTELGEYLNV